MTLKPITKENFNEYYALLEKDFILEERRVKQDELNQLNNSNFKPFFIYNETQLIGYFTCWEFEDFIFGEHFAILQENRDRGIGTKFLKEYLFRLTKPFIFEIEKPVDATTKRRKRFYKRLNFKFNKFKYFQPSYHNATDKLEMVIVSYPKKLTKQEYLQYIEQVKKEVYKV